MGFPFVLSGLTVQHQALLQRQMRFGTIAAIELASLVLSAGIGIIAAAIGLRYWALVIMANAFSLFMCALVLVFCRWRPGPPQRGGGVRSMLRFGGALTTNNLFNSFGGNADKLLLGKFETAGILGLYSRAQTLMLQPLMQFMPAVQNVVLPVLSRLAEERDRMRSVFLDLLRVTAFVCSFMTVYIVVDADWLVRAFLGPRWMEAGAILRLFAGPAFVIPLNALCVLTLTVQGKTGSLLRWGVMNNAITILAVAAGLPWGARGVAAGLSIASVVILAPLLIYLTSNAGPAGLRDIWSTILPAVATCIAGCALLYIVRTQSRIEQAVIGLPLFFFVNLLFHAGAMTALPSGRRAFANLRGMVSTFRNPRVALQEAT
jgi:PST family polysaccharide transporter